MPDARCDSGRVWLWWSVIWLSTLTAGLAAYEQPVVTVRLRPEVAVDSPYVVLGHVAEVSCPAELTAVLKSVSLGPVPPGPPRRITVGAVKLALRRAKMRPNDWRFEGAEVVYVRRAEQSPRRGVGPSARPRPADEVREGTLARGDHVTVVVRCGAATISGEGELLAAAAPGDRVKVRLLLTRRLLRGTLGDHRRVLVDVGWCGA